MARTCERIRPIGFSSRVPQPSSTCSSAPRWRASAFVLARPQSLGNHDRVSVSTGVSVARVQGASSREDAARIWAAATAHRDGKSEPAPTPSALPIIERGLSHAGATLHLASLRERAAGFALVVPQDRGLEILYLGVDPQAWGAGVASRLLADVCEYANETSSPEVELWVYDDNTRAVDVYTRSGWVDTGEMRIHPTSGRRERRYSRSMTDLRSAHDEG